MKTGVYAFGPTLSFLTLWIDFPLSARHSPLTQLNVQAPGWGGFFDRIKAGYYFGFFESAEDAIRNPVAGPDERSWLLRPSITFPLAFLTVGVAFAVLVEAGGISERGATIKDELDEVVLDQGKRGEPAAGWFN